MTRHRGTRAALAVLAGAGLLLASAVTPAGEKKEESGKPPKGATVLFNGKDLSGWQTLDGKPAEWKVEDGYMEVVPGKHDIKTKDTFGPDFKVHVEFWLPLMADKKDQARANSGVYLQGRYEIQVLDSYMNDTYADGSVGALYRIIAPDKDAQKKAVKPPEQWNTYDITFRGPRTSDGKVIEPGHITVRLNDVAIIDDGTFSKVPPVPLDDKIGTPGPLRLQDHGCKVRFRNIWLKPLGEK
jgi:Domain of Unknown Function (DUF1080)